jgi:hypothetical protein
MEVFGAEGMLLNDNLRPTTLRRYGMAETEAREPLLNFFLERYADAYRLELDGLRRGGRGRPAHARHRRRWPPGAAAGRCRRWNRPRPAGAFGSDHARHRVGIIGTGFMGRAHALAYRAVSGIFPVELRPVLEIVADNNPEAGRRPIASSVSSG